MSDFIGQSLGRYHIVEQLGEGGMATVYKAYDTRLEADVAVKVIRTEELPPKVLERALKRFEREAKALAKLTHANIVKVIDYGEYEGKPYLVMPYLSGGTLKQRLTGSPLPWREAVKILLPIARALDYAHRQGMIHRDVKPSNILITEDGDPLLTDFGIAKIIDDDVTLDLTGTSATVGTPEYMAPEQVTSKTVDHRADIYALGVVFYEMVTGRKLYTADTPMAVLFKHASEPLPRPTQYAPDLPAHAEQVLFKALAKKPEDRYQSMGEFANTLESLLRETTASAKRQSVSGAYKLPEKKSKERKSTSWLALGVIGGVLIVSFLIWGGARLLRNLPAAAPEPTNISQPVQTDVPTVTETLVSTLVPTETETSLPTSTPTPPPTTSLGVGSTMTGKDGMTLLYVPAGEFIMGSDVETAFAECKKSQVCDRSWFTDQAPPHTVLLDAFWIDQTEVTNKMYALCVNAGVCTAPLSLRSPTRSVYYGKSIYDNYPVVQVDWNMAKTYCEWADRRLLTEAEWEKAARGIDGRAYPWGNDRPNDNLLNYEERDTTEVGKYPMGASPYGVLDIAGNVAEWVSDWYSPTYYANSPLSNPLGPDSGKNRVVRDRSLYARLSAKREWGSPRTSDGDTGFRCAMNATP